MLSVDTSNHKVLSFQYLVLRREIKKKNLSSDLLCNSGYEADQSLQLHYIHNMEFLQCILIPAVVPADSLHAEAAARIKASKLQGTDCEFILMWLNIHERF